MFEKLLDYTENIILEDSPFILENLIDPKSIFTWQDLHSCINDKQSYHFECIDSSNKKHIITDDIQNKLETSNGLVISDLKEYNENIKRIVSELQDLFYVDCSVHIYCGLSGAKSFNVHEDNPCNFIIQLDGSTEWKVYNKRLSTLIQTGTIGIQESFLGDPLIHKVLKPGDVLYVPSRMWHVAIPSEKRLSMSIPCNSRRVK